ncbi:MAG: phosphatase PAP2 family protein, partial [Gemmatimonadetes bacterium]|nr:phosphatase PAP2 family protein [Gemmatimonadota bacterium]
PFRVISLAGISWGVILVLGFALWLWGREAVYSLVGIIVLEALVSLALNRVFAVPRPSAEIIVKYEHIQLGSFPSGHLFTTAAVWGWLYASGRVSFGLTAAMVVLVGTSRMYLGVHYLGDLVGAVVFAAVLVWGYSKLWPRIRPWLVARPPAFFTAAAVGIVAVALASVLLVFPGNPYVWNASGVMIGGTIALFAEPRVSGYEPSRGRRARLLAVAFGIAGFLPPLVFGWVSGERMPVLSAVATGFATLWVLLAAPALARRFGGTAALRA